MKKNTLRGLLIVALILAVFCVIAFFVPFAHTTVFWIGYGFGVLAILFQLYILKLSFAAGDDAKSRFYGFPIARIGVYFLVSQLIASVLEMALAKLLPVWVPVVINVLLLAATLIGCITADTMREEIVHQDGALKKKVSRMRELQSVSATLVSQCANEDMKETLVKIAEEFRFSDPVSSEKTEELEADMRSQLESIQQALVDDDIDGVRELCKKLMGTLAERNRICAISK